MATGRAVWFGREPRGAQQRLRAHRVDQGAHPTQFERPSRAQLDEGARQRDRGVDRRGRRRDDGLVARAVQDDSELRAARLESNIGVDIAKAGRRAVVDEKQEFARQRFQRLIFGDGSREPRGDFIGVERSGVCQRRRHDVEPAFRRRVRREQSDGFEARLRRGERCLADAAYLQLRALREIDPAIAAIERDRGDFAQPASSSASSRRFWRAATGRRRFPSASTRRDTIP